MMKACWMLRCWDQSCERNPYSAPPPIQRPRLGLTRRHALKALGISALAGPWLVPAFASEALLECPAVEGFTSWGRRPILLSGYHFEAYTAGGCWSIERSLNDRGKLRFELHKDDSTPEDIRSHNVSERAEFNQVGFLDQHRDILLSFTMMIEPGPPTSSDWTVLGQFHQAPDPGDVDTSPPFAQVMERGDLFRIVSQTFPTSPLLTKRPPQIEHFRRPNFERGRWHQFEYRIRFSPDQDGLLQCRFNGEAVVNYRGGLGYRNTRGPYFKFGIYRGPAPEPIAVQYSNITLGYG